MTKKIENYLKKGRKRGVSDEKLKEQLLEAGFSKHDINKAFRELKKGSEEERERRAETRAKASMFIRGAVTGDTPFKERVLLYLFNICSLVLIVVFPLLVLWLSSNPFLKNQAKLTLNWHFSFLIYAAVSALLMLIIIGFVTGTILVMYHITISIICARANAYRGLTWKIPFSIEFISVKADAEGKEILDLSKK